MLSSNLLYEVEVRFMKTTTYRVFRQAAFSLSVSSLSAFSKSALRPRSLMRPRPVPAPQQHLRFQRAKSASTTPVVFAHGLPKQPPHWLRPGLFADTLTSTAASSTSQGQGQSQSQGASGAKGKPTLKLVRVVGSKYVDFFTDGTTILSFAGDPSIDANLNKPKCQYRPMWG